MAQIQAGFGRSDTFGVPYDLYAGATLVTGATINMQTGILILNPTGTLATLIVNLPLNPGDGTVAELSSTQIITALTVNANTADVLVNGVLGAATTITPTATAGGSATAVVKYKYTLTGFQPASGPAVNARTWFRVQ